MKIILDTWKVTTLSGRAGVRPELILIEHNIVNDMKVLDQSGIKLHDHFNIIGIADTQVLVQDITDERLPHGLPDPVLQYQLYHSKCSRRKRGCKGGSVFLGAHNAGNDVVANLRLDLCLMLDSLLNEDNDLGNYD